jgi:tripartite-type tricarboxylate transporter receptor subunit TctC
MASFGLICAYAHAQLPAAQQAALIVPYPAGSAFDITARQIQPELGRALNKTIIVENIGGASGSIGAQRLLSADPGRLNMLMGSANELALPPLTLSGVKYKPGDFRMVAHLITGVLAILAQPDMPADNLGDVIAAGTRPGATPVTIANAGMGSIFHVAAADFSKRAGAVTHVPYRGGAPIAQDLMARQVDLTVLPLIPSSIQAAQEKKIKVLAVTGPARPSAMPDAPSVDELPSLKGLHYSMWTAKLPAAKAEVFGKAANAIVASPSYQTWVKEFGNSAGTVMDLDQAAVFYRQESDRFQRVAG